MRIDGDVMENACGSALINTYHGSHKTRHLSTINRDYIPDLGPLCGRFGNVEDRNTQKT